jgi:hypothetical protein
MLRIYIDDCYTFPEATRDDLQRGFDAFEDTIEEHATLADQIGDLDMAADLGKRQLSFQGFIDRREDDWPRYYVTAACDLMFKFAGSLMYRCDIPRATMGRRTEISAADGSFAAVSELRFTAGAP